MLKQKILKGLSWNFLSSITTNIVSFLKIVVLTHFLSPVDFGLMAIVTAFLYFAQIFLDLGIGSALIYYRDSDRKTLSSVFWLNVVTGISLFVILSICGIFISSFYQKEILKELIFLSSTVFLISSVVQIYIPLFERDMKFSYLSSISIFSNTLSFLVAVFLAINGYGVYSLVYSLIVKSMSDMILLFFFGFKIFIPSFYFSIKSIKRIIKFGMFNTGDKLLNYINLQIDIFLLGKVVSTNDLGFYSVSKQITSRPYFIINPVFSRVFFPALSTIKSKDKHKELYLKLMNVICSINFPLYMFIIVLSEPAVNLLLGEGWEKTAIIIQVLSLYFLFRSLGNPVGVLILSLGRADIGFYWNFFMLILISMSVFIGSFYGTIGVALSLSVLFFLLIFLDYRFLVKRFVNVTFSEYIRPITVSCFISLVSICSLYPLKFLIKEDIVYIATVLAVGLTLYTFLTVYFNPFIIKIVREALWKI